MPRLNKKQLKDITVFRERQEEILPLSLNEMYLEKKSPEESLKVLDC